MNKFYYLFLIGLITIPIINAQPTLKTGDYAITRDRLVSTVG